LQARIHRGIETFEIARLSLRYQICTTLGFVTASLANEAFRTVGLGTVLAERGKGGRTTYGTPCRNRIAAQARTAHTEGRTTAILAEDEKLDTAAPREVGLGLAGFAGGLTVQGDRSVGVVARSCVVTGLELLGAPAYAAATTAGTGQTQEAAAAKRGVLGAVLASSAGAARCVLAGSGGKKATCAEEEEEGAGGEPEMARIYAPGSSMGADSSFG
jgi:hypothetical protein